MKEVEIVLIAARRLEDAGYTKDHPTFMDMLKLSVDLYIDNKQYNNEEEGIIDDGR